MLATSQGIAGSIAPLASVTYLGSLRWVRVGSVFTGVTVVPFRHECFIEILQELGTE